MGSLEKRLQTLEDKLAATATKDGLDRQLFRAAYRRLSIVEMLVMGELRDSYRARPGLSPAEIWRELTEAQRAMQYRWLDATRDAARGLIEAGDLPPAEEAELKGFVREVGNHPFWKEADESA